MIKNVIVVNDYDFVQGGASLVAIEQANLLFESGYNVVFFCGVSKKENSILNPAIRRIVINKYDSLNDPNKIRGMLNGANNKSSFRAMLALLDEYDSTETVVSIHGYTKCLSASFVKACQKRNVKTILTAHDYFSICPNGGLFNYKKNYVCNLQGTNKCKWCNCDSRNYLFKLYRNFRFRKQNKKFQFRDNISCLITISETNEKLLKPFFGNTKTIRIYNPTSINFKPERAGCEDNDYYLYVGRIDKEKGIDMMCESFKRTGDKLLIAGTGSVFDEIKSKYASDTISFLGWKNHDEIINLMRGAKSLVFPCLLFEGAPLTIFEAQSQGLPCIVSKYSNAKDFVNEHNGWIYDPFDCSSLISVLKSSHHSVIKDKSENSFLSYWNHPFDKATYLERIRFLLDSLAN